MRIYFSGGGGLKDTPEALIPELGPHVMLTFHTISTKQASAMDRLHAYLSGKKRNFSQQDPNGKGRARKVLSN